MFYRWDCEKPQLEQHKSEYIHLLRNTNNPYLEEILPLMIQDLDAALKALQPDLKLKC